MATIYLFRHGQASFGAADYDRLSPLGERQATLLGHYLRDSGIVLDAAFSGDLLRQRQTARAGYRQPTRDGGAPYRAQIQRDQERRTVEVPAARGGET